LTLSGVAGLNDRPSRNQWQEGAGSMMVHTIIQDPDDGNRMYIAISAAGVFRTIDGGNNWEPINQGVPADFLPETYPEVGQCCHHLVQSPDKRNVLYQQNHCSVFGSMDGGDTWEDIGTGRLLATFGFPVAVHRRDGKTVYIAPQKSDEYRYTPMENSEYFAQKMVGKAEMLRPEDCPRKMPF